MRLDIITEDKDVLLVETMLQEGVIDEGVLDIIDTATEALFGAVGFIPGAGEVLGDAPMLVKNLVQGDYLGAAIFLVSMEPTPISDAIAKTLRAIQKLAKHTGMTARLNRLIGWLVKKTGNKQTAIVLGLFDKAKNTLAGINDKIDKASKNGDAKIKRASGIMDKVSAYVSENMDKMKAALEEFLGLIEERAKRIEPAGGADELPDQYIADLTKEIEETYHQLRKDDIKNGTNKALLYKKKLRSNADRKQEVKTAYEEVFGPIPEIE